MNFWISNSDSWTPGYGHLKLVLFRVLWGLRSFPCWRIRNKTEKSEIILENAPIWSGPAVTVKSAKLLTWWTLGRTKLQYEHLLHMGRSVRRHHKGHSFWITANFFHRHDRLPVSWTVVSHQKKWPLTGRGPVHWTPGGLQGVNIWKSVVFL